MRKHTKKDGLKEQRKEEKRLCCCVEGSVSPRTNAIKIAIAIGLQDMLTKLRCWILSRATSLDMNKLTPEWLPHGCNKSDWCKVCKCGANFCTPGGSPGLVVMGDDSWSRGRWFESRCHLPDGHFSHWFVVKLYWFLFEKTENKQREAGDGPFIKCLYLKFEITFSHALHCQQLW